jgi:hypothetical protein
LLGKIILQSEQIAIVFIEFRRPDGFLIRQSDQLCRDAHLITVALDRSVQYSFDAQVLSDLHRVLVSVRVSRYGAGGQHRGLVEMAQPDNQSVGHPQAENFGLTGIADRFERQDGNAGRPDTAAKGGRPIP